MWKPPCRQAGVEKKKAESLMPAAEASAWVSDPGKIFYFKMKLLAARSSLLTVVSIQISH